SARIDTLHCLPTRRSSDLLAEWLRKAMANGEIDELPIAPLARLLAALISEASLYTARADDPATARRDAGLVIDRVLAGLRRTDADRKSTRLNSSHVKISYA